MKRLFLFAIAGLWAAISAWAYDSVEVTMVGGAKQYVQLTDQVRMTVGESALRFVAPNFDMEFPMDEVKDYKFSYHQVVALENVAPDVAYTIDGGVLRLNVEARLFDLQGRLAAEGSEISLSSLPAGVYVLSFPTLHRASVKISVR